MFTKNELDRSFYLNVCFSCCFSVTRPSDNEHQRFGLYSNFYKTKYQDILLAIVDDFQRLLSSLTDFVERWSDGSPEWQVYRRRLEFFKGKFPLAFPHHQRHDQVNI